MTRDNYGMIRKYVTLVIDDELEKKAYDVGMNLKKELKTKLYDTYVKNIYKSQSRNTLSNGKYTYHHTNNFIKSISTVTEPSKRGAYTIGIDIDENIKYDNGKNAYDVYTFLTHGTTVKEPGYNPFISGTTKTENGRTSVYKSVERRPMRKRTFDEDTLNEMTLYLDELKNDLEITYNK